MSHTRHEDAALRIQTIRIRSQDGAQSDATVFTVEHSPPSAVIVCIPAMGVAARYYESVALELARLGFCVVTTELRGIDSSSVRASRSVDFGYRELIVYDLSAVIAWVRALQPAIPLLLLGHSIGAHISAMYAAVNLGAARGLIYIAAGTSFFKNWPFPLSLGMLGIALLVRAVSAALGYFPGRFFGVFGREARRLIREWSILTMRGRFDVSASVHDFEQALPQVALPILALSFEGDHFAPETAVKHLLSKTPRAAITTMHLRPIDLKAASLDHFRWTRYPVPLAAIIARWIAATPDVLSAAPA